MSNVKERMIEVIQSQPDDASYEEIMRELAFEHMVERGLADSRSGRVISNEDMEWTKEAKRRLIEFRSGSVKAIPGEDIFGKVWKRFDK